VIEQPGNQRLAEQSLLSGLQAARGDAAAIFYAMVYAQSGEK